MVCRWAEPILSRSSRKGTGRMSESLRDQRKQLHDGNPQRVPQIAECVGCFPLRQRRYALSASLAAHPPPGPTSVAAAGLPNFRSGSIGLHRLRVTCQQIALTYQRIGLLDEWRYVPPVVCEPGRATRKRLALQVHP